MGVTGPAGGRVGRRAAPAQQGPPADLAGLPEAQVRRSSWFREHQLRPGADGGCWYFASLPGDPTRESGRFDLPGPEGTCYAGDSAAVAAMERVGRFTAGHKPVPADFVSGRVVTEISGDLLPGRAANLASRRAGGLGVTGELFTMPDYTIPQAWAAAVRELGYDALLYPPRFTPAARAVAHFGQGGAHPRRVLAHRPLRHVLQRMGVKVAEIPASTTLTIIDPT